MYLNPTGNMHEQKLILRHKCALWVDRTQSGSLPRHLVWLSFHSRLLKSLEYVLNTSTFTETECDWIIRPALEVLLQGSGFVKTFPRKVVFGPLCLQGLGIPHPYHTQGIFQVKKLLKHSDAPESTMALLL